MTTRLVYNPRVYVFTKDAAGNLYDLTNYVVSGEVVRNISQVSSATVTIRNPFRIFTTPSAGVAFHPQDPITIYLERIAGFPVRVFTGYLDKTVYYQLQPGTITLNASCTLKRLLYTFFDPSLPYVISFFQKYGWENSGSGSIFSPGASSATNAANAGSGGQSYNDSSFAKLLWAILYEIGNWDDSNIWIEPLPKGTTGLVARMQALATSMQIQSDAAQQQFSSFLNAVIGGDPQGSGGGMGATGTGSNVSIAAVNKLTQFGSTQKTFISTLAQNTGLDPIVIAAWVQQEGPPSGIHNASGGAYNYLNIGAFDNGSGPLAYSAVFSNPTTAGKFTAEFLKGTWGGASNGIQGILDTAGESPSLQIAAIQNSGWATSGEPLLASIYQTLSAQVGTADRVNTTVNTVGQKQNKSSGATTAQSGSSAPASGAATSIYDCIVMGANALANSGLPYLQKHFGTLAQPWPAYDCSGSVSYVLYSAGLIGANDAFSTGSAPDGLNETEYLKTIGFVSGPDSSSNAIEVFVNTGDYDGNGPHTFMRIGGSSGRYFGTTDGNGGVGKSAQGAGAWLDKGNTVPANAPGGSESEGYVVLHYGQSTLAPATYQGSLPAGGTTIPPYPSQNGSSGSGATGTGSSTSSDLGSNDAFVAQLTFPSIEDSIEGILLGAEGKGLMHDQSLMPFVQQVCQASMRSFMSLPNGDFFAFYPDYFGEMGQHEPYWLIKDVEIISGEIDLTDDALATHVYAVGDNTYPVSEELMNELFSAGSITVFNAFQNEQIITTGEDIATKKNHNGKNSVTNKDSGLLAVMNTIEATEFVKRFGARPLVQNYPQVRSTIFEMLLAYQQFMLAWSNQFVTPFSFTFMPEIFPGGKVAFPSHGFKMYVNQVTHTFDYTEGFTTSAQLSAPSLYGAGNPDLPPNMVSAIAEPVLKNAPKGNSAAIQAGAAGNPQPQPTVSQVANTIGVGKTNPNTLNFDSIGV